MRKASSRSSISWPAFRAVHDKMDAALRTARCTASTRESDATAAAFFAWATSSSSFKMAVCSSLIFWVIYIYICIVWMWETQWHESSPNMGLWYLVYPALTGMMLVYITPLGLVTGKVHWGYSHDLLVWETKPTQTGNGDKEEGFDMFWPTCTVQVRRPWINCMEAKQGMYPILSCWNVIHCVLASSISFFKIIGLVGSCGHS